MSAALVRLALLQFIIVVLTIFLTGFTLRVRLGSGTHFPILATYVRDYGVLLLLLPTAWTIWGAFEMNRSVTGTGDSGRVLLTGIVILALLVCLGLGSIISASSYRSLIISVPERRLAPGTSGADRP